MRRSWSARRNGGLDADRFATTPHDRHVGAFSHWCDQSLHLDAAPGIEAVAVDAGYCVPAARRAATRSVTGVPTIIVVATWGVELKNARPLHRAKGERPSTHLLDRVQQASQQTPMDCSLLDNWGVADLGSAAAPLQSTAARRRSQIFSDWSIPSRKWTVRRAPRPRRVKRGHPQLLTISPEHSPGPGNGGEAVRHQAGGGRSMTIWQGHGKMIPSAIRAGRVRESGSPLHAKKHRIEFQEVTSPITTPVTKFGGQPVWVAEPQWPLSRQTGNPMRFICQIALDRVLFPGTEAQMAYLFMTEEEDGEFVDGTYEPDGGENAVILQPGTTEIPTKNLAEGPTL
jgi:hypothetical protein